MPCWEAQNQGRRETKRLLAPRRLMGPAGVSADGPACVFVASKLEPWAPLSWPARLSASGRLERGRTVCRRVAEARDSRDSKNMRSGQPLLGLKKRL